MMTNKMAQRALGRSPEEKVKGHSGAINRGPLMLYTKYQGSSRFLQADFQDFPILLYINQTWHPGRVPFNTRGIFWTFFLATIRTSSFRQEDFWKLHFENLFLTLWPTYATNQNHWNNFGRGPPRDHSCRVWSNSH